jgi:hypothetical protein
VADGQFRPLHGPDVSLPRLRAGKKANETMGGDKFFEQRIWKRLFAQDETAAAEYARETAAAATGQ